MGGGAEGRKERRKRDEEEKEETPAKSEVKQDLHLQIDRWIDG